jgi:hypothetical protein
MHGEFGAGLKKAGQSFREFRCGYPDLSVALEAATATTEEEIEEQEDKNDVEAAATVVAEAGASIESAAAYEKNQDDEKNDHVGWMRGVRCGVVPVCVRGWER